MFKTFPKTHNQHGFTLLEIMLVLLLMGMMSVGVVMTLPNSLTSEEDVLWQAQRFSTLLQFAEDEALISGLEIGLVFNEKKDGYQFAFYDHSSEKWLAIESKQIQGQVTLPEIMAILYRPIVEEKNDVYTIKAYDGDIRIRAEQMKQMSAEQVQSALVFFYTFANESLQTLQSFLTERLKEMKTQ